MSSGYSEGTYTPSMVIEDTLRRIEKLEPKLNAFDLILTDTARQEADKATKAIKHGFKIGPFHGVPFALKDLVDVKGYVTAGGTVVHADRVATNTARLAKRLLAGGGILMGKTKTVEVAYGAWGTNSVRGTPWNPWDENTQRTPGGSSSGSAVAVASGMVGCAVGTDTGGSVRIPASWCGLVGLKVTEGRLPTEGILPLSHTLDTPGVLARSVRDVTIMFETMDGQHPKVIANCIEKETGLYGELQRGVTGLTFAALSEKEREGIDNDILEHYDSALLRLGKLGAQIVPVELAVSSQDMRDDTGIIISYEGYHHHGSMYEESSNRVDEDVKKRILMGREIKATKFFASLKRRKKNQARVLKKLHGIDAYITPTLTSTPRPIVDVDQTQTPARFTRIANYLALCSISVPMGLIKGEGPMGLQINARGNDEAMALRIAAAFERDFGKLPTPPMAQL
ncbi:MAG: 2-amino-5-chloromuconic acid deaminase [Hyphomicrobiaceae bacterium hypho_1]